MPRGYCTGYNQIPKKATCFVCKESYHGGNIKYCIKCGNKVVLFGTKFRTPSKKNIKQWTKIELLNEYGFNWYDSHVLIGCPNEKCFYELERRDINTIYGPQSKPYNLSQVLSFLESKELIKTKKDIKDFKKLKNKILKKQKNN